jgi:hypothetical protein
MGKVRGTGGFWALPGPLHYATIVHNATYEVLTEIEIRETRSIGCGGWTEGLPKIRRVVQASFRVAEDDVSYPQVLGFTEGKELNVYLKRGELPQFDFLYRTIVKSVRRMKDEKKAIWVEIVCQHGQFDRNRAAPLFPPPPEPEEPEEEP